MSVPPDPAKDQPGSDADWLMARLPDEVHAKLGPEDKQAIIAAARNRPWTAHPVDIRVSFKLPYGKYYVCLVAGPERRPEWRVDTERRARNLMRLGNVLFVLASVVIFYGVLVLAALLLTAILE
jgi:hypothetical protein